MWEELYWTSYYIWINPSFWSLLVFFVLCGIMGYCVDIAVGGWLYIILLCFFLLFLVGGVIFSSVNLVQEIYGTSPKFLSEFHYIAQLSWIDNIIWGSFGLGVGAVANHIVPPTI